MSDAINKSGAKKLIRKALRRCKGSTVMSLTENQAVMELLIFLFSTFLVSARSDMAERNAYLSDLLTDNRIKQEGDLMLGGIFSVNTTQDESGFDFPSLLQAQAMIYQVDKINMNQNILPDYTLGYEMMDDCYRVDLAVKAATMFMMGETALDRRRWIVEYRKKRMEMAKGGFSRGGSTGDLMEMAPAVCGGLSRIFQRYSKKVFFQARREQ